MKAKTKKLASVISSNVLAQWIVSGPIMEIGALVPFPVVVEFNNENA